MPPKSAKRKAPGKSSKAAAMNSSPAAAEPSGADVEEDMGGQVIQVIEYKAANNETPKEIATHLGVNLKELLAVNKDYYKGLKANSKLQEGTLLEVPGTARPAPSPAGKDVAAAAGGAAVAAVVAVAPAADASALPPAVAAAAAPAKKPRANQRKRSHHKKREWKIGERVEARYPPDGNYYEAVVAEVGATEYTLNWTERDEESDIYRCVPIKDVRTYRPPTQAEQPEDWGGETYLAAEDETPKHVAKRLGVMLSELLSANEKLYEGLEATSKLMAGTMLRIPVRLDGAPVPTAGAMLTSDLVQTEKIEKLIKKRVSTAGGEHVVEYLVKLRRKAHIHNEWMSTSRFDLDDTQMKFKLKRFAQKDERMHEDQIEEEEALMQGALEVERMSVKTKNFVSKPRNCVFKMMNFAASQSAGRLGTRSSW